MDSVVQDLRYSLRGLAKHPGVVLAAVLSLAIGIGVNTAIFSVLNALLLRPVPIRDADRTVVVYHASPDRPERGTSFPAFRLSDAGRALRPHELIVYSARSASTGCTLVAWRAGR